MYLLMGQRILHLDINYIKVWLICFKGLLYIKIDVEKSETTPISNLAHWRC